MMAAKNQVTHSSQPTNYRGTTAERRASQIALLSTRQAELKQEAADRRAQRAIRDAEATPAPVKTTPTRRNRPR